MVIFQTDHVQVTFHQGEITLVLKAADTKGNVLTQQTLTDLGVALGKVAESNAKLLTLRSGKMDLFCRGWDLQELVSLQTAQAREAFAALGQTVFNQLAQLPMPTVAVITGPCLGGGLELALACDYRLVVDRPHVQLGLPQVGVGLLPTWGGTQRLPAVVGLEDALPLLLTGKRLNAAQALALGLIDLVTPKNSDGPWTLLASPHKRPPRRLPLRSLRQKLLESHRLGRWLIYRGIERVLGQRLPDDFPAPAEILQVIRVGIEQGLETGLQRERAAFVRLAETAAAANLVHAAVTPFPSLKPLVSVSNLPPLRRVGIVGSTEGAGLLARLVVIKGSQVMFREPDGAALGFALLRMVGLFHAAVEEGYLSAKDRTRKLNAIRATTGWEGFADLDLVLVINPQDSLDLPVFFAELEKHTSTDTILVSVDPCASLQALQEKMKFPERCVGLHFIHPQTKGSLVEVVKGPGTSAATISALTHWFSPPGNNLILIKDCPGGLFYRFLMPHLNEAIQLVSEGIPPVQIDEAMRRFGLTAGPLETMDRLGLDVMATIAQGLEPHLGERFVWHPLVAVMQDKGWLGQKAKRGFYLYRRRRQRPHPALQALVAELEGPSPAAGLARDDLLQGIQRRLVHMLVNEAARAWGEKLVESAEVLDRAVVLANCWPDHRGGPLHFGQQRGYRTILADLADLAKVFGCRYEPSEGLRQLADAEKGKDGNASP